MGALPLISTISFLLIFERETVALSFVDLLSNLRQLLHCRPWIRSFKKDDLPVSFIPSLSRFLLVPVYFISEDVRVGT